MNIINTIKKIRTIFFGKSAKKLGLIYTEEYKDTIGDNKCPTCSSLLRLGKKALGHGMFEIWSYCPKCPKKIEVVFIWRYQPKVKVAHPID